MNNINTILSNFYKYQKQICYLQSFKIFRDITDSGCSLYNLNIIFCDFPFYPENKKLILKFKKVRDLKIGCTDGLIRLNLKVTDISNYQMEDINLKVTEIENNIFNFYCKTFEYYIN